MTLEKITGGAYFGGSGYVSGGGNGGGPTGSITMYGGIVIPDGWLKCDGSTVSRTDYKDLFDAIGTSWGIGDGSTTFHLPDFRGLFPRGVSEGKVDDPDRNTRYARNGGNAGDQIGSYQSDQYRSHNHSYTDSRPYESGYQTVYTYVAIQSGSSRVLSSVGTSSSGNTTGGAGGNESRAKNAYVYFIIKT